MSDFLNTGFERCQTLTIDKKVNGASLIGYPKTYSIRNAFTVNANSYGVLDHTQFMQLTIDAYFARLADFKLYVYQSESNIDIDEVTEVGYESIRVNTTSCPIGEL